MPLRVDGSAVDPAVAVAAADVLVEILVDDPAGRLGRRPTLRFHRHGRTPAVIERSILMDAHGHGRLVGWTPVELFGVDVIADPEGGATQGALPRLRRIGRIEMVVRVALRQPLGLARVVRLYLEGNAKGGDFRFARLWDRISAPDWAARAAMQEAADVAAAERLAGPVGVRLLVAIGPGTPAARALSRADLAAETSVAVCDIEPAAGLPAAMPGDLFLRLPAGARLTPGALRHLTAPFAEADPPVLVWCDEDRLDRFGRRRNPLFGPVWDPLLVAAGAVRLSAAVLRRDRLPEGLDPFTAPLAELAMAVVGTCADAVVQVPRVLVHVPGARPRPRPVPAPPLPPEGRPAVSVVIPSRDRADLLATCLDGLARTTAGGDLDVIVVDNGSVEPETAALYAARRRDGAIRVVEVPEPFNFARLCNLGVAVCRNELVLLLNNDVEPIDPDWLQAMVAEMQDPSVGAVGARLLYPDRRVQHGGVVLGVHPLAQHAHRFAGLDADEDGGRLGLRHEASAVTAACLLTRRSLWEAVGGMDEGRLAVAYNDVDYCLALRALGARVIWTPGATLIHAESVSRRDDDTAEKRARFAREEACVAERWPRSLVADPFGNPNFSLVGEPFVVAARPHDASPRRLRIEAPCTPRGASRKI